MLDLLFGLMLECLLGFLEILFDAAFEFAAESIVALIWRGLAAVFDISEFTNPWLAVLGYIFLGGAAGGLTLLLFPHPLVYHSRVRGISLFISPILTGLGMWVVGNTLRRRNQVPLQIQSFGYGSAFAFGLALVRVFFVR